MLESRFESSASDEVPFRFHAASIAAIICRMLCPGNKLLLIEQLDSFGGYVPSSWYIACDKSPCLVSRQVLA